MSKNVLVLMGSPRRKGNSEYMAEAFTVGAKDAGHTVTSFNVAYYNIRGCIACNSCFTTGAPCALKDDFNERLVPLLMKADVLALSMPLYFFGFPAQIKAAIDRFYCFLRAEGDQVPKIKQSVFMICGGDRDEDVYKGAVETYKQINAYMKWKDCGILVCPGVSDKEDILAETAVLRKARALGAGIV